MSSGQNMLNNQTGEDEHKGNKCLEECLKSAERDGNAIIEIKPSKENIGQPRRSSRERRLVDNR